MNLDDIIKEMVEKEYQKYRYYYDKAEMYEKKKDYFKALIFYKACIDYFPNQVIECIRIGYIYYRKLKPRNMSMANRYFGLANRMFDEFDLCESLYEPDYYKLFNFYYYNKFTEKRGEKTLANRIYKYGQEALKTNNVDLAISLFEESIKLGEKRAYYDLGCIYRNIDINKSFSYFYSGVLEDSKKCYKALSEFYYKGIIVEKDKVIGRTLIRIFRLNYIFQDDAHYCSFRE